MKNIIIFVLFILALVFFQFATAQSVDEIIHRYITARGGLDKLNSIQSVAMEGMRQMMGSEVQVKVIKVDGKLFRTDFEFGGNTGFTIVTPEKGWTYIPMRSDEVSEIPAAMLKNMQVQLDIAGALVNYKAKGYKADLQGKENINGRDTYKVALISSDGKETLFFIDTKNELLIQTRQMSESGRNANAGPREIITNYRDYLEIDGIMFPQTIETEGNSMGAGAMTFDKIEINQPVDEKLFKPSR